MLLAFPPIFLIQSKIRCTVSCTYPLLQRSILSSRFPLIHWIDNYNINGGTYMKCFRLGIVYLESSVFASAQNPIFIDISCSGSFMSFYYMACCREEPVLTFESELYFEPLMALSCFTFVNPRNTLSHDSSLGGRRGLLCRCLWWGPVCTVHFSALCQTFH